MFAINTFNSYKSIGFIEKEKNEQNNNKRHKRKKKRN